VWISIEQSVVVTGIVCVFMGFVFVIGRVKFSLLIRASTTNRLLNYRSDFAENWLKGVDMCLNYTCEISQSDHPFQSYDQKFKYSIYMFIIG